MSDHSSIASQYTPSQNSLSIFKLNSPKNMGGDRQIHANLNLSKGTHIEKREYEKNKIVLLHKTRE